jgi:3-hydroxybutyryl-CoA dehydrogenase
MTDRFARVAVVGTGMMGPGMAVTMARGGSQVAIYGRTEESVARGLAGVEAALSFLVENQLLPAGEAPALRKRIRGTSDLAQAVDGTGLVQESIAENLEAKRDLFRRLEGLCSPDTLLTSNTSGLLISQIATVLARPARAATMHYWNPPHLVPLVEISQGERTSTETVEALHDYLRRCGQVPVVARKDIPGQIANRLQHAMLREALYLVQEGVASASDVDLALKMGPGRRWPVYGVIEHQDVVGLDLALSVQRSLCPDLYSVPASPAVLEDKVEQGELGVKTGRGFYDWSQRSVEAVKARRDALLCVLAREWKED